MRLWKLRFGNKAMVLSLDAFFAVLIFIIILTASSLYLITAEQNKLTKLQLVRIGSDITTILEYQGLFNEFGNLNDAETKLNSLLSTEFQNYDTNIEVYWQEWDNKDNNVTVIIGNPNLQTTKKFVGTGKRYFISNADSNVYFGTIKYQIAIK